MDISLYIKQFFIDFIQILNEMSPYLLLGFFFAGLLKVAIPQKFIDKYMGKKDGRSVLNASLLGIPMPLCSCGVIPTGISFYKSGASKGSSVSFLISTPQTGVDSILVTYSLLGLPFAIIRPVIALITGYVGGMLANRYDKKENGIKALNEAEIESCKSECRDNCDVKSEKQHSKLYTMFKYAFVDFLQDISKWLVIGLLLAALISVALPDDFFASYIGNDLIGMLVILVASVPLYICATSSVPVAAVLLMKGVSPGAALVFLMAGPATNAATITVLNKVLGKKTTFAYLISIILGALVFGLLIDYSLPREWFTLKGLHAHMGSHDGHFSLPLWLQWGSSISLTLLIINGYIQKEIQKRKNQNSAPVKTEHEAYLISVLGMSCNHCKNSVEKHIGALSNINNAEVNLEQKRLKLSGKNIKLKLIQKELESLGFEYGGEINQ